MPVSVRLRGEQRNKQAGRPQAKADGRLHRKSNNVRVWRSNEGELCVDLPDERGFQYVSMGESS
jgi:hypothetical protein